MLFAFGVLMAFCTSNCNLDVAFVNTIKNNGYITKTLANLLHFGKKVVRGVSFTCLVPCEHAKLLPKHHQRSSRQLRYQVVATRHKFGRRLQLKDPVCT